MNNEENKNLTPAEEAAETAETSKAEITENAPKPTKAKKKFNARSFKHGTMAVVFTIVFIAAVVVVNVIVGLISERFDTTADLTDAGIYSLSENTE